MKQRMRLATVHDEMEAQREVASVRNENHVSRVMGEETRAMRKGTE